MRVAGYPIEYEGSITCRTCGTTRPHTDFYKRNRYRRTDCRFCCVARAQASDERIEVADERWMRRRDGTLRRKYGIGQREFDALVEAQGGKCGICGTVPEMRRANTRTGRTWTALVVDHDHETGTVRGLLCLACNTVLGRIETIGAERFLAYLT